MLTPEEKRIRINERARQHTATDKGRNYKKEYRKKNKLKHAIYARNYYLKNQKVKNEKQKTYSLNHHRKKKLELMNLLGGPFCAECGCNILRALEFNHIFGGGSKEEKQKGRCTTPADRYRQLIKNPELIKNFNVLCRLCNAHHYLRDTKKVTGGSWNVIFTPDHQQNQ